jgi:murein L,D-transpeptidase YafK
MPFEMYKVKIRTAEMKNHFVLTAILLSGGLFTSNQPTGTKFYLASSKTTGPVGAVYILIDKSDYELSIYDNQGWYATYPVVFGNNSLSDKKMEGDRNTPEGTFKITSKRVHDKWYRFMSIDYPNKESWEKFTRRKQQGEIPAAAKIGGGIGIHGTWPHEDFQIDRYSNWTLGCISMKNEDVEEIYKFITPGTKVIIRR